MKKITKLPTAVKDKRLRVAAYARVSTDSDEQLVSLDAQREYYDKLIRRNPGWDFAGLFYDMLGQTPIQMHPACTLPAP